ncbi:MAG: SRPBCC domain-containing protein [Saprospiraceae bacterium]|nr:SRPBCC domain-containing protein [Saprospiraceae bacterium]
MITVSTTVNTFIQRAWKIWTTPFHIQQWNAASDDWHCPHAENDLRDGGRFLFRMAARDGSMEFDFTGQYTRVIENQLIEYTMDDGRKARIEFNDLNGDTEVIESFDPENMHSHEMQRSGWQAILDRFKKYSESLNLHKIRFEYEIHAPVEIVYERMLAPATYQQWTAAFNPGSYYKGTWETGSKILFVGTDEHGNEGGMVSRIQSNIPNECVCIQHLGVLQNGSEITDGPEVDAWAGCMECYYFSKTEKGMLLKVEMDTNQAFEDYFKETWPKALELLKEICED